MEVTVVIPTRNRANLLRQALASVQGQTNTQWQVLVIDDGSTDGTAKMVETLSSQDKRIRYLERVGGLPGGNDARNFGLQHAETPYVLFLDSDDALGPRAVEDRLQAMTAHPELDFGVFHCLEFMDNPGDSRVPHSPESEEEDISRFLKLDVPWQTASPLWRRESLARLKGPWDPMLTGWQDWDFHLRAMLSGMLYQRFPGKGLCYWRSGTTQSISRSAGNRAYVASCVRAWHNVYEANQGTRRLSPDQLTLLGRRSLHIALRCGVSSQVRLGWDLLHEAHSAGLIHSSQRRIVATLLPFARFKRYIPGRSHSWWWK